MTRTALYRHFDDQGRLLYVGISKHPTQRLSEHERASDWAPLISRIEIEWHDTRGDAETAEVHAIRHERPKFNRAHADAGPPLQVKIPRHRESTRRAYSPKEFADIVGCTRQHVQNLIARGELPSFKLGNRRFIPVQALDDLIATVMGGDE